MTQREQEIESILRYLMTIPHELYRGIDYTWATKFRLMYHGKLYCPDVTTGFHGLIATRQPIGEMRMATHSRPIGSKALDCRIPYVMNSYSKKWRKQVDDMFDNFENIYTSIKELHVDEDISIIKNLFVQVANKCGIDTFVHQHGALGQKHGFLPLTANNIIVWDERNKFKLISWGLEPGRIVVGGYSERYDPIIKSLKPWVKEAVRKEFGFDDRPILLFSPYTFSNFGDGQEKEIASGIYMIQEAIRRLSFDRFNIVVKLHPSSPDLSYWEWWEEHSEVSCRVVKDYNPYELAYASEIMVVQSSTYAIDGIQLGKRVITIDSGFTTCVEEYYGDKLLSVASSVEDILNQIQ